MSIGFKLSVNDVYRAVYLMARMPVSFRVPRSEAIRDDCGGGVRSACGGEGSEVLEWSRPSSITSIRPECASPTTAPTSGDTLILTQCLARAWPRSAIYRLPRNWRSSSSPSRSHCKVNKPRPAPPNATDGSRNRPQLQPRTSHSDDRDTAHRRAIRETLRGRVGGVQVLEAVLRGKRKRVAVWLRSPGA